MKISISLLFLIALLFVSACVKDTSRCNKFQDQLDKNKCYTDIAKSRQDTKICENVKTRYNGDDFGKDYCYAEVAKAKQDISICDNIAYVGDKTRCYGEVALAKQDSSLCENFDLQEYKDGCYYTVATKQGDAICDTVQTPISKDYCYFEIAITNTDVAICNNIQEQFRKDECYRIIAIRKQEISICDYIQIQDRKGQIVKDQCYGGIANAKHDASICNNIQDQNIRTSCIRSIKGEEDEIDLNQCVLQTGIVCLKYIVTPKSITIRIENSLGYDINIDNVAASQCTALDNLGILQNGIQFNYDLSCINADSKYDGQLNITYTGIETGFVHKNSGILKAMIEE